MPINGIGIYGRALGSDCNLKAALGVWEGKVSRAPTEYRLVWEQGRPLVLWSSAATSRIPFQLAEAWGVWGDSRAMSSVSWSPISGQRTEELHIGPSPQPTILDEHVFSHEWVLWTFYC
ncbi:hypothetical protein MHYP_G00342070 [Metynnis hypsauchen]